MHSAMHFGRQTMLHRFTNWSQNGGHCDLVYSVVDLEHTLMTVHRVGRRFCVVLVRPVPVGARTLLPRSLRLADALRRLESDNDSPHGDILPFVQFADKRWTLCVDLVPIKHVRTLICLYTSYTAVITAMQYSEIQYLFATR